MTRFIRTPLIAAAALSLWLQGAFAVEEGDPAIDLVLPALQDGGEVSLDAHAGKIVYLDFWASWCPPCLVSMPIMNELRNRLQAEGIAFEVVAVNVDSDPGDGIDFLLDKPVDFVVLSDPGGVSPAAWAIVGMPTSFLIDAGGTVVMRHQGFKRSDGSMIESEVRRLAGLTP